MIRNKLFALLLGLTVSAASFGADTKVSALPAASALTGTEAVPIVQSGATVRTTANALATFIAAPTQTTGTGILNYTTACTVAQTQGYAYVKTGLQVTLTFTTQFACTSNSTTMVSDALPAAVRPVRTQVFLATAQNNSGVVPACFAIDAAGVVTWYQVAGAPLQCATSGTWTASGTKGPLTLIGSSPFIASSSAYSYTLN